MFQKYFCVLDFVQRVSLQIINKKWLFLCHCNIKNPNINYSSFLQKEQFEKVTAKLVSTKERLEQEKQDAIVSHEKVATELKTQLDKLHVTENRSSSLTTSTSP